MNKNSTLIALVDDHALLRSGLASLVQSFEGYTILFEADNGKDFIAQLKSNPVPPDMILLDITMPEMNGLETALWIKKNQPSIKILVLSMMDNDEVVISMLKAGARGYILKDSKPAVFRQALDNIRDTGFFLNELISNKMLNYVTQENGGQEMKSTPSFSDQQLAFLQYACSEMTYKEIATAMHISMRTVEGYRDDLLKKLNLQSRIGLVLFAIKNGLYKL